MKTGSTLHTRDIMPHALRLLGVSILSVWAIDTLVILRLFSGPFGPSSQYYGLFRHFAGLLLVDVQLGIVIAAGLVFGAWLLSHVRFLSDFKSESLILLSSLLISLAVLDHSRSLCAFAGNKAYAIVCGVLVVFIPVYIVLHVMKIKSREERTDIRFITRVALFPSLVIGLILNSLWELADGHTDGLADLGLAVVLIACMIYLRRRAKSDRTAPVHMLPLALSVIFICMLVIRTLNYGDGGDLPASKNTHAAPSVALIVLDTVRADHLSIYGYERNTMPYLEKWAENGIVFERAVSGGGWTSPSHACIWSGRTVSRHGVHYGTQSFSTRPLEGFDWLPALLGARGYYALAVSANPLAFPPTVIGFDRILCPSLPLFAETLGRVADEGLPFLGRASERLRWRVPYADARGIVDVVKRALPESTDAPVFLFVNFLDAHSPYNPPEEALDNLKIHVADSFPRHYTHRRLTHRWQSLSPVKRESLCSLYDGELRWLDMQIAELLPWLESTLGPESVIIVVSDHGEELGEEGRVGHEAGLSQSILHVPLFIGGNGCAPRSIGDVVSTRRLFHFILSCSDSGMPTPELLIEGDEFSTIAERYPTTKWNSPGNPLSHCPRVACIQGSFKVVGPSICTTKMYDIEKSGFRDGISTTDMPEATSLLEFIDTYWDNHADIRDESSMGKKRSGREHNRLRSLGYIN